MDIGFIFAVIVGLFTLIMLVVVHELGHAIVARRNGVVVEEFGIGFPPRAWAKKLKNGVLFTINWLPLGGFVKLQGEHDAATKKGDYGAASFWAKTKILLAGVVINWLTAAVIFTLLAVVGLPKIVPDQFKLDSTREVTSPVRVASVTEGSPAAKAGLQKGESICEVAGTKITSPQQLVELTEQNRGKSVQISTNCDESNAKQYTVLLNEDKTDKGYLGVGPMQDTKYYAGIGAPVVGIVTTAQLSWLTLEGLGKMVGSLAQGVSNMFSLDRNVREQGSQEIGTVSEGVAGPLGIIGYLLPSAVNAGIVPLLMMAAILSLSLAIMNILPIPALDGGRFYTMAVFRLLKKPLTKELEEKINATGFLMLMGLVLLVTIADVSRIL